MIRTTTNAVLKNYRYNLQKSNNKMNDAMNVVLTGRKFTTFAEDPAAASRAFQLRRSFQRVQSQLKVSESVGMKYDVAYKTIEDIIGDIDNRVGDSVLSELINGQSDTSGAGRNALGQTMGELAKSIVQKMNSAKFGDTFAFAGADGVNVPFTWDDNNGLCYRGIPVDSKVPKVEMDGDVPKEYNDANPPVATAGGGYYKMEGGGLISKDEYNQAKKNCEALEYLANDEKKYVDIGLGLKEDENGNVIGTSAFDSSLQGINYLGYGVDEDGDPKNIVSLVVKMSDILKNCDPQSGEFKNGEADRAELTRLAEKFGDATNSLKEKHIELTSRSGFLRDNKNLLTTNSDSLNSQIIGIEKEKPEVAISNFSWAKYCYNTALKVGNSVLSQSLMDFINT